MKTTILRNAALLSLVAVLCLPIATLAQTAPLRYHMETYVVDTGLHSAPPSETKPSVVYSTIVDVPDAPWLRLNFSDADLGSGSYITVTSLYDEAQQDLNATALAQTENSSAYFNGDALKVELYVAPGDHDIFVQMDEIMVGDRGAPETQCGPTDDRVSSTDDRTGRLLSIGCTAWLIGDGRFVSAGHCTANPGTTNTVQFNVPASTAGGTIQHPGPEDQYTVDDATIISVDGGVGNDWGVFETFVNGTSGMTAIQAQGDSWGLAQDLGPPTLRITGYGVDGGVDNQTQQTHAGPNAASSGTTMRYQTDTQGGNSGSPVIDDATDIAVGVHTHGGCFDGGGNNNGTSTFNTAFWDEIGDIGGCVFNAQIKNPVARPGDLLAVDIDLQHNRARTVRVAIFLEIKNQDGETMYRRETNRRTFHQYDAFARRILLRLPAELEPGAYKFVAGIARMSQGTVYAEQSFVVENDAPTFAGNGNGQMDFAELLDGQWEAVASANVVADIPGAYVLEAAYPNPFNPTSTITYALAERGPIALSVYNTLGQRVAVLASGVQDAGRYEVQFDASSLPSGVYMYTLRTEGELLTGRLMLVK